MNFVHCLFDQIHMETHRHVLLSPLTFCQHRRVCAIIILIHVLAVLILGAEVHWSYFISAEEKFCDSVQQHPHQDHVHADIIWVHLGLL